MDTFSSGTVVSVSSNHALVMRADGSIVECQFRGKLRSDLKRNSNLFRVGDRVKIGDDSAGGYVLETVLERNTAFSRLLPNSREKEQVIAANPDQVVCVVALHQPDYRPGFIDRILVMCERQDLTAIVIINKIDLGEADELNAIRDIYSGLDLVIHYISLESNIGTDTIESIFHGKMSVVVGPSGVGKSTLINRLKPELTVETADVSDWSGKGMHTTTIARYYPLTNGAVIDTPGVREFGLIGIASDELSLYFPDFEPQRSDCKFYNCRHINEPGCQVLPAVETGVIHASRYRSYRLMHAELLEREDSVYR